MALRRAAWLTLATAAACGASPSALHEGDLRFEHCMALDHEQTKPQFRRACWEEWVRYYSFGQTRDRIDYATSRAHMDPSRPPPAAPGPTNMAAPPPIVASAAPSAKPSASAARPDASACAARCDERWSACERPCGGRAPCVRACADGLRSCTKACFAQ